ncbi:MAG TPA: carbonic anhydrase [Vitreoscilla sp.]|jgi:carbonic anhydrase|nr:carbonic anhydrase [Vitreoscilla sp.]
MTLLAEILDHNKEFVDAGEYVQFFSDKFPNRGLAILSCMDARIIELLNEALGLKNGDAKMIKNAGALVTHPWGSVMRSLLVAVFELRCKEIMVVAHYDCGMRGLSSKHVLEKAEASGISATSIETLRNAAIDLDGWLTGFDDVGQSVRHSVEMIRNHPLMPKSVPVHGLVIHPTTGKLDLMVNGYDNVSDDIK